VGPGEAPSTDYAPSLSAILCGLAPVKMISIVVRSLGAFLCLTSSVLDPGAGQV